MVCRTSCCFKSSCAVGVLFHVVKIQEMTEEAMEKSISVQNRH